MHRCKQFLSESHLPGCLYPPWCGQQYSVFSHDQQWDSVSSGTRCLSSIPAHTSFLPPFSSSIKFHMILVGFARMNTRKTLGKVLNFASAQGMVDEKQNERLWQRNGIWEAKGKKVPVTLRDTAKGCQELDCGPHSRGRGGRGKDAVNVQAGERRPHTLWQLPLGTYRDASDEGGMKRRCILQQVCASLPSLLQSSPVPATRSLSASHTASAF